MKAIRRNEILYRSVRNAKWKKKIVEKGKSLSRYGVSMFAAAAARAVRVVRPMFLQKITVVDGSTFDSIFCPLFHFHFSDGRL